MRHGSTTGNKWHLAVDDVVKLSTVTASTNRNRVGRLGEVGRGFHNTMKNDFDNKVYALCYLNLSLKRGRLRTTNQEAAVRFLSPQAHPHPQRISK